MPPTVTLRFQQTKKQEMRLKFRPGSVHSLTPERIGSRDPVQTNTEDTQTTDT